jgi:hypothetical protein
MATAIETATTAYLYAAAPSQTGAKPTQQRALFQPRFAVFASNGTFIAEAVPPSVSSIQHASPVFEYSQTSADLVVAQLIRMESWEDDWDGAGAAKPLDFSLKDARKFVRDLSPDSVIPQPTLHADGHAILFINNSDTYAELEFLEDHRIGFYVRLGGEEWAEEISFDGRTLPDGLLRAGFAIWTPSLSVGRLSTELLRQRLVRLA